MSGGPEPCALSSPALPARFLGLEGTAKEASNFRGPSLKTAARRWEGQRQELQAVLLAHGEQAGTEETHGCLLSTPWAPREESTLPG